MFYYNNNGQCQLVRIPMNISRAKFYNVLMYRLLSNLPVKGKCKEILHFCKVVKKACNALQ